jgi:hypothetical protein
VFNVAYFPAGCILDYFGPKVSACVGALLVAVGSVLFAFASGPDYASVLIGFTTISMGGPFISLSVMSFAFLVPSKTGTIVMLFVAMLDASCMMLSVMVRTHPLNPACVLRMQMET